MIKDTLREALERMQAALDMLEEDLSTIRTGRASPSLIERMPVEYYGTNTPLIQLASISVPEPRQLLIRPFDPSTLKDIDRAILASDLGLTPNNDGKAIRLTMPQLTEERRHELVRVVHNRMEETRVKIRNIRRDLIRDLREFEKEGLISEDDQERGEKELQELTDKINDKVQEIGDKKEKEIMEV
ncbi:MAG: ribosome recycling factor [Brevefilum sp.]|nr:ribosome recycling factor [Brevefilum sp.]MDT8381301.1 ribosome recycling factor [Brevefilum sp.]MDW7753917.1 ribosome recycling factor [Brevefilum sp.]